MKYGRDRGRRLAPPRASPAAQCLFRQALLPAGENEVETAAPGLGKPQDERGVEDSVACVPRLAGEVELGRQNRPVGGLRLDVNVAGPPPGEGGGGSFRAVPGPR